ncbi:MAG: hypothetical protein FJY17_01295, partial [Bacteroidetes bacterium]|nr:hypothetical protein [Bacteroidota bacterium]
MNSKSTVYGLLFFFGNLLWIFLPLVGRAQPVISIGQVQACRGTQVNVPIRAQLFNNVSAVSLSIRYDTSSLVYTGFNSESLAGNLIINEPAPRGRILISWFSLTPLFYADTTLLNLNFLSNDSSNIFFDFGTFGANELANVNGDVIPGVTFIPGSVTTVGPLFLAQLPPSLTLNNGNLGAFSVSAVGASSFQWQFSIGGGVWSNLINDSVHSGVTSSTLTISALTALSGRQYRVRVSGAGCPDQFSDSSILTVNPVLASVSTAPVTAIGSTQASCGGEITTDGGAALTSRGVAYGNSQNPTISNAVVLSGTGRGTFTSILSGLFPSTTYHVRAFGTNSVGTAYGNEVQFTTLSQEDYRAALRVSNQTQVSDSIYEFDVYIQSTGAANFRLANYQFGLGIDTQVLNGGSLSAWVISGTSELVTSQRPSNGRMVVGGPVHSLSGRIYRFINLIAAIPPNDSSSTSIIPSTNSGCSSPGIRIARFRITNTMPFRNGTRPFHIFSESQGSGRINTLIWVFNDPTSIVQLSGPPSLNLFQWNSPGTCDVNPQLLCSDSVTINQVGCFPYSFHVGGQSFTSTGTYYVTLVNRSGCDSVITINLVVHQPQSPVQISGPTAICLGSSATFGSSVPGGVWSSGNTNVLTINPQTGQALSIGSGSATITYTYVYSSGCSGDTSFVVAVNPPIQIVQISGVQVACEGNEYSFAASIIGGKWFSSAPHLASIDSITGVLQAFSPGILQIGYRLTGYAGCPDSTYLRALTINSLPNAGVLSGQTDLCVGSSYIFSSSAQGGYWLSSDESVATVDFSSGEVYGVSPGMAVIYYVVSGSSVSNRFGWSSLITPGGGLSSNNGNTSTPSANTASSPQEGCEDAVESIFIEVSDQPVVDISFLDSVFCLGSVINNAAWNSVGYWSVSDSGILNIDSVSGVISVVGVGVTTLNLTLPGNGGCGPVMASKQISARPLNDTTIQVFRCYGGSYNWNGVELRVSGIYTDTFPDQFGCDSTVNLNFIIGQPNTHYLTDTICLGDSIFWNGLYLLDSGVFTDSLMDSQGCDSVIVLELTLLRPVEFYLFDTLCAPGSYTFNGQALTASGVYSQTHTNAVGCDSVVTLNLIVNQPSSSTINEAICSPSTYSFNGVQLSASGVYLDTL